jgi:hypothetical protein
LDFVHVSWNDVAVADQFVIYRNTLDEFDTASAIATNVRAGNELLDEDFRRTRRLDEQRHDQRQHGWPLRGRQPLPRLGHERRAHVRRRSTIPRR